MSDKQFDLGDFLVTTAFLAVVVALPQWALFHFGFLKAALWLARMSLVIAAGFVYLMAIPRAYVLTRIDGGGSVVALSGYMLYAFPNEMLGGDVAYLRVVFIAGIAAMIVRAWMMHEIKKLPGAVQQAHYDGYQSNVDQKIDAAISDHQPTAVKAQAPVEQPSGEVNSIKYRVRAPRHNFNAVTGMKDLVAQLKEAGVEASQHKGNGVLLWGEPGNGKTFFAEALAGELKMNFLPVTYGDVASKWINETTENVVKVFADARQQAPCVLFLDEIDSLIADRSGASSSSEEANKTTNAILTALVDLRSSGVIIVAATNFMDRLDPAAIREGRFDYKVEVPAPDFVARLNLLNKGILRNENMHVTIDRDTLDRVAARWEGFSVARLQAVVKEIRKSIAKNALTTVDHQVFMDALRTIQGRAGRLPEGTPSIEALTMPSEQKQALEALSMRMRRIDEIERMGGSVPRGVLFFGPPGTGKTLTARALAKSSGWAFLPVSGNDLLNDSKLIDKILREAADIRPAIVFIDEADDVFAQRAGGMPGVTSITNKLLGAMDGAKGRIPDVLFIAATNHPDQFDEAALRGGRFSEKIEFQTPGKSEIDILVGKWLADSKIRVTPDVTSQVIGELLRGQSNADLKEVLQSATNIAVTRAIKANEGALLSVADVLKARQLITGA